MLLEAVNYYPVMHGHYIDHEYAIPQFCTECMAENGGGAGGRGGNTSVS